MGSPERNSVGEIILPHSSELTRRADVEGKQERIAQLLEEVDCEGLLVFNVANFAWLTSGGQPKGLFATQELPCLYFTAQQRYLICSNVDTQRLFDEEINELGFQLKEWLWNGSRERLLADICHGRRVASDQEFIDCTLVRDLLRKERRLLTLFEQNRYAILGRKLAHALEATARQFQVNDPEEEVAGQIGHRLLHHGVEPVHIQVMADDRGRHYRRAGFTATPIQTGAILQAMATCEGLYAAASRMVAFEPVVAERRSEFDMACRINAIFFAGTRPGIEVNPLLETCRRQTVQTPYEHEWRLSPAGYRTGRLPVETLLGSVEGDRLRLGQAVIWQSWIGGALVCDTVVVAEGVPLLMTAMEGWPIRRIRIQQQDYDRPDLLIRRSN